MTDENESMRSLIEREAYLMAGGSLYYCIKVITKLCEEAARRAVRIACEWDDADDYDIEAAVQAVMGSADDQG